MSESNDLFSIVASSEGFGYGKHLVYRNDDRIESLVSHGTADGFEAALRALSQDYRIITIDEKIEDGSVQEWGYNVSTESLQDVLSTAEDAGLRIQISEYLLTARAEDPTVRYFGFEPSMIGILSEPKFAELLEKNGFALTDGDGQQLDYSQVDTSQVWVYDPSTDSGMAVLHDGIVETAITSNGFKNVLKLMDEYLKTNYGKRLILSGDGKETPAEVEVGHAKYDWEFDYEMTRYVEP